MGHRRDYTKRKEDYWCASGRAILILMLITIALFFVVVAVSRGNAQEFDEYGNQPATEAPPALNKDPSGWDPDPAIRSWFKSVRSPHGVPCCDIADGHRTAYDTRPDNHYWVPIEGEWRQVPPEAVVYNAGNPVGEAVVWFVIQSPGVVYIRCFVPGGGV